MTFLHQLFDELRENTAVCIAHAHHVFIDIDAGLVDTTKFKLIHQVVVHLLAVYGCPQFLGFKRCEARGESFLNEMLVHT